MSDVRDAIDRAFAGGVSTLFDTLVSALVDTSDNEEDAVARFKRGLAILRKARAIVLAEVEKEV